MGSSPVTTPFEKLNAQILALPLWVKQVLYSVLKQELENLLSKRTLDTFQPDDTLQLWKPEMTHGGNRELENPTGQYPPGVLKLLHYAKQDKTIVDITILSGWTLEQCCIYLLDAISKELINPPKSGIIQATILYLSGRVRLGEYLVKIGRLTVEQLDQALRTQRYIEESLGERTGIGNVLINLGYINKQDSEGILFLKEESKKTFNASDFMTGDHDGVPGGGAPVPGTVDAATYAKLKNQLIQANQRISQLELMLQQRQKPS
jgi:hypothetical protein